MAERDLMFCTAEEEVLRRGQLCYQDGADYQRTLAPLVQSEAAANFKKTTAERLVSGVKVSSSENKTLPYFSGGTLRALEIVDWVCRTM